MKFRPLGATGLEVSSLGYGALRLPMEEGHVKTAEAVEVIHRAFDLGVNLIDTGVGYCRQESEITVGKALTGRRDDVIVSTKNNFYGDDVTEWRRFLDQSLERLDVNRIDIYSFHRMTLDAFRKWKELEYSPLDEMTKAKEDGLIDHIGMSCHDTPQNMVKLLDTGMFESIILQYNLLDAVNEAVITHAHESGIGVIVMGPLGGGRLSAPSGPLLQIIDRPIESTAELALRFVLSNPLVSSALSGMGTHEMVEGNAATASIDSPLTEEEKRRIRAALEEKKRLSELYCTGCGYCMPCPQGVDIPRNFELVNYLRVYGLGEYSKAQYRRLETRGIEGRQGPSWAAACIECGECEEKCPQNIEIRKQMKEARLLLEIHQ